MEEVIPGGRVVSEKQEDKMGGCCGTVMGYVLIAIIVAFYCDSIGYSHEDTAITALFWPMAFMYWVVSAFTEFLREVWITV